MAAELVDDVGGINLLVRLMRPNPDPTIEPPRRWIQSQRASAPG